MTTSELGQRCKAIYESKLKERLEKTNFGDFIAIEPESEEYFLGKTMREAGEKAEVAYPDRRCFVLRVGYRAAVFIGGNRPAGDDQ